MLKNIFQICFLLLNIVRHVLYLSTNYKPLLYNSNGKKSYLTRCVYHTRWNWTRSFIPTDRDFKRGKEINRDFISVCFKGLVQPNDSSPIQWGWMEFHFVAHHIGKWPQPFLHLSLSSFPVISLLVLSNKNAQKHNFKKPKSNVSLLKNNVPFTMDNPQLCSIEVFFCHVPL